jgi:hypothetical protein
VKSASAQGKDLLATWLLICFVSLRSSARRKPFDLLAKLKDFEWTLDPIVIPADHEVATINGMSMVPETPALKLELDSHANQSIPPDSSFGFAVRKGPSDALDEKS